MYFAPQPGYGMHVSYFMSELCLGRDRGLIQQCPDQLELSDIRQVSPSLRAWVRTYKIPLC